MIRDKVKQIAKNKGLKLKDIAAKLNITVQSLDNAIGKPTTQLNTLQRIADAMGVPLWQLLAPDDIVTANNDFLCVLRHKGDTLTFDNKDMLLEYLNNCS